jgi:hypothetical protein
MSHAYINGTDINRLLEYANVPLRRSSFLIEGCQMLDIERHTKSDNSNQTQTDINLIQICSFELSVEQAFVTLLLEHA